jgi:hypothetical protein
MRKTNLLLIIALAVALMASALLNHVHTASAQQVPPTGIVVAYTPGQSITIVDQQGVQHEYLLSTTLKILPPGQANSIAVGSFVTIIAPASLGNGKETAVGIVIHPNIPNGWNVPSLSATPLATNTPMATTSATPTTTGTQLATETTTATATVSGTPFATETGTATETPTAIGTFTETPTATPTPVGGGTTATANSFFEWLRSLLRTVLARQ